MGLFEDVKTHLCGKKAARSEMKQKNCNNITKMRGRKCNKLLNFSKYYILY